MKKIKLLALTIVMACFAGLAANADTIGYVNYKTVEAGYSLAKQAYKELDAQYLEMQQYLMDKEKQYKNIDSPLSKKNFEEAVQKDFKTKNDKFTELKLKKAEEVENNILAATKAVAAYKNVDVVVDYRVLFTGGVDLTDDVLYYLNNNKKFKPAATKPTGK